MNIARVVLDLLLCGPVRVALVDPAASIRLVAGHAALNGLHAVPEFMRQAPMVLEATGANPHAHMSRVPGATRQAPSGMDVDAHLVLGSRVAQWLALPHGRGEVKAPHRFQVSDRVLRPGRASFI